MSSLPASAGIALDGRAERLAVRVRHHHVQDDDAVRVALGAGGPERLERRPGPIHLGVPAAPGVEHAGDHSAVGRVVVHREDAHAGDVDRLGRSSSAVERRAGPASRSGGEPERRPDARRALHADLAAHELDEAPADGQAQAGAAEAPRGGGVGLRERLEQHVELLGRDADAGVAHLEAQRRPVVPLVHEPDGHRHLAALGELDGVADQVGEDLAQAPRVAAQGRRARRPRPAP